MFGRAFLVIIVLIALSGITLVAFAISDNNNTSKQNIQQPVSQQVSPPVSQSVSDKKNIVSSTSIKTIKTTPKQSKSQLLNPSKVKLIVKKYIKLPGASPGTPKLTKEDGIKVYVVPVIKNKTKIGEIDIDAYSGKNLGGAGGAPK